MSGRKYAWTWADYERELAKDRRAEARKADKLAVADSETAVRARPLHGGDRCEGEAPEGTSGAAAAAEVHPANASQTRPLASPARGQGKISLAGIPSGMEARAERWRSPVAAGQAQRERAASEAAAGRAFCKCGGNGQEGGYVPADFGRDCIEKDCPLRGSHA